MCKWKERKFKLKRDFKPFAIQNPTLVYLVLWDLGLSVSFIMIAVIQARYLPHPLGKCENLAQLDHPGNGRKVWIDVMIDAKSPYFNDRLSVCKSETTVWSLSITCG